MSVDALLERYREAAAGTGTLDPQKNNACAAILHECYKQLRDTEEGRKGIISLVMDADPHVRGWAGAHSLQWAADVARPVLEGLRDSDGPGSFDAKWTLIAFDEGSLKFD